MKSKLEVLYANSVNPVSPTQPTVLEVVEDQDGSAFRTVYTVKFRGIVYVLHAFQKKSNAGIKTPAADLSTVRSRLKDAEKHYAEWIKNQTGASGER